jgi:hypothetical protein
MKSEMPERLLGIMKRATRPDSVVRSDEGQRQGARLREASACCCAQAATSSYLVKGILRLRLIFALSAQRTILAQDDRVSFNFY